jgi:pimeloyl-ACP methyl ester carboxylesterase
VFECGGASWSLDWHPVQAEVAGFTRTLAYDRAGFGWSDPGPRPRTAERLLSELRALLARTDVPPPYVLVGASFGGHIMRLFAHRHPGEVAGLLLLDARHEALDERMPPVWRRLETNGKGAYQVMLLAARLGLLPLLGKALGERGLPPAAARLPDGLRDAYLAVGFRPAFFRANLDELAAIRQSDAQLRPVQSLGALPTLVVRHGLPDLFARFPPAEAAQAEQAWQSLQAGLAAQSTRGRLLVADQSGHAIPLHQPDLVVALIRQLVQP